MEKLQPPLRCCLLCDGRPFLDWIPSGDRCCASGGLETRSLRCRRRLNLDGGVATRTTRSHSHALFVAASAFALNPPPHSYCQSAVFSRHREQTKEKMN
ncbi:unnamed protein product [Linum trigynum]|uniref:Uncharacterized protein n=1 Tax=Linum trigynum TaxID=586398 RepID=A0AAV2FTN9_9ROSI